MGSAYTPGLTVSESIVVRRTRRLPIKGEVLVQVGQAVTPEDVVARAMLPGILQTLKLAEKLGVEPKEVPELFRLNAGDPIEKGQAVAETKGLFGLFKNAVTSDYQGTVESVSPISGNVLIREAPIPVDVSAYVRGTIADVLPQEGAIVETHGAMVQGIFGVGSERTGTIRVAVASPEEPLEPSAIHEDDAGKILVGGSGLSLAAIRRAAEVGVIGLVAGGVRDGDLIEFLGYDIGVAITGQENIPLTLMVTEGFGYLPMAARTFALFQKLEGESASMNGATQIRAGVIRPEIIVPRAAATQVEAVPEKALELAIGTPIRVIREPYFGALGKVTELPSQLMTLESGTEVRVLRARLEIGGDEVLVPRANVEILAT